MNRQALEAERNLLLCSIERARKMQMKREVERYQKRLAEVERQLKAIEPAPCEMWAELREGAA